MRGAVAGDGAVEDGVDGVAGDPSNAAQANTSQEIHGRDTP
jgi:hypothetical protein